MREERDEIGTKNADDPRSDEERTERVEDEDRTERAGGRRSHEDRTELVVDEEHEERTEVEDDKASANARRFGHKPSRANLSARKADAAIESGGPAHVLAHSANESGGRAFGPTDVLAGSGRKQRARV